MGEVMTLSIIENGRGEANIIVIEDNELKLRFYPEENGDYYMLMIGTRPLNKEQDDYLDMDISKNDGDIYNIFSNMYDSIIEQNEEYPSSNELVDEDKNVVWVSDDGPKEKEDNLTIIKNEDTIKLRFVRNNSYDGIYEKRKMNKCINIRFCTHGTRYTGGYHIYVVEAYQQFMQLEGEKVFKK